MSRSEPKKSVFGHILYDNTAGYSWTEPAVTNSTVQALSEALVANIVKRQEEYVSGNGSILFLFGTDFYYQEAPIPFESMEKLMGILKGYCHADCFIQVISMIARMFTA